MLEGHIHFQHQKQDGFGLIAYSPKSVCLELDGQRKFHPANTEKSLIEFITKNYPWIHLVNYS